MQSEASTSNSRTRVRIRRNANVSKTAPYVRWGSDYHGNPKGPHKRTVYASRFWERVEEGIYILEPTYHTVVVYEPNDLRAPKGPDSDNEA